MQRDAAVIDDARRELGREPRLADARLARDHHQPPLARGRALPRGDDGLELLVASDARAAGGDLAEPRRHRDAAVVARPHDVPRDQRIGQTLQLERADRHELVAAATPGEHPHDVGREDLVAARRVAQARRFDDRRPVEVAVLLGHVAGAHTHAHDERRVVVAALTCERPAAR